MDIDTVITYAMIFCASIISLTLHECAHGYTALRLGDPTAKQSGRLTLNPLKHIDPLGLLMFIVLKIGWAKPVPVNPAYFKDRKKGMLQVSLAGPLTNLILAFIGARILVLFLSLSTFYYYPVLFFALFTQVNIGYAIFNILPFPPLDGSKIFASLLPAKWEMFFYRYQKYMYILVFILYFLGVLSKILYPAINFVYKLFLF